MLVLRNVLLAVVAGFGLNLAFPDTGWWPLAPVSVAVLWWALERVSAWGGFAIGWIYGTAFMLPHVIWADSAVGAIPWVALAVAEGLAWGLLGAGWAHVRRSGILEGRGWLAAPAFALIWVGIEQLRGMVPFGGFPWGRLGYALVDAPVAKLASLGGVPLVTLAVALAGAYLGQSFEGARTRRPLLAAAAPVAAIAVLAVGYAVPVHGQAQSGTLRLGVVQGNVPDTGLDAFNQAREVTLNHRDQTLALVEDAPGEIDLVVWPENAADIDPRVDAETMDAVLESAQAAQAPLLLGTVDYTPVDGRYNTSLLISTEGEVLDTYSKQRPAPFAEYIPLREIARQFAPVVDRVTDMIPGTGVATMDAPIAALDRTVRLGTVICFEVAYDSIVREAVANGAEVIIVQTNNASFGRTAESTQQLQMTRMRAIETGRYAVQASTVGVSAVVDPAGRVLADTELFTPAHLYASVGLRDSITPAVRFGWFIGWGLVLLPVLVVGAALRRRIADRYDW